MRKTSTQLLSSRPEQSTRSNSYTTTTQTPRHPPPKSGSDNAIPTIRLISATPSAAGDSSVASSTFDRSWNNIPVPVPSIPSPLLPSSAPKKRLVPKKSKLSILSGGSSRGPSKEQVPEKGSIPRSKDFSDVIRRVGAGNSGTASSRGFEIHVDSTEDPDLGDIVMVKKKKSRAGLNGMRWGNGALEEVTNVPHAPIPAPAPVGTLKEKNEKDTGSGRWWALGRGRKDSKDKPKENTINEPVEFIAPPRPSTDSRARFNSLDSRLLLDTRTSTAVRGRVSSAQMLRIPPSPTLPTMPLESPPLSPPFSQPVTRPQPSRSITPTPTMSYANAENVGRSLPPRSATPTPTMNGLLAPPFHIATIPIEEAQAQAQAAASNHLRVNSENVNASNQGSIAVRAMKSMRSMARLGGWASSKDEMPEEKEKAPKEKSSKEKSTKDKKESKREKSKSSKKDKTVRGEHEKKASLTPSTLFRLSTSSFEAGALTASPGPARNHEEQQTLGKKKRSVLGIGLGMPSTVRLPSIGRDRSGSTASSAFSAGHATLGVGAANRLSADSAPGGSILRSRSGSGASSLRPRSTCSGVSRTSSTSTTSGGAASVRWDEACLETVKEKRRKERQERRDSREKERGDSKNGTEKEKRHSAEGRRRTSLMDVFPETRNSVSTIGSAPSERRTSSVYSSESQPIRARTPLLTLEEATNDGHSAPDSDRDTESVQTPIKVRARPRPVSEQLLGKSRPVGMPDTQSEVLSMLSAATNDLAQLINVLDLEATPGNTPDMTPAQRDQSSQDSPTKYVLEKLSPLSRHKKNTLRESQTSSIASLRTVVAKRKSPGQDPKKISQQIAPWPAPDAQLSPLKIAPSAAHSGIHPEPEPVRKLKRLSHKRSLTPSPAPEISPLFQPLRPATSRKALNLSPTPAPSAKQDDEMELDPPFERILSMVTFGSAPSSRSGSMDFNVQPVFTKPPGHSRRPSSLSTAPRKSSRESAPTSPSFDAETKRVLGLAGTMGESSVPIPEDVDPEDPDSDIPDELQNILATDDATRFKRAVKRSSALPSPGKPPFAPLPSPSPSMPSISLPSIVLSPLDLDAVETSPSVNLCSSPASDSDDNTKKSFDFTGEIRKLNESGVSHRKSFVEQLETAFKTPAKIDLRYGFEVEGEESFFRVINGDAKAEEIPPVPKLDPRFSLGFNLQARAKASEPPKVDITEDGDGMDLDHVVEKKPSSTHGELNKSFRFGGNTPRAPSLHSSSDAMDVDASQAKKPLTLSDIIPTAEHCRSLSMSDEDSAVLKSIFARAEDIDDKEDTTALLPPFQLRQRVNSDTSIHHRRRSTHISRDSFFGGHSTRSSLASFTGFESFEEVRRGFEFNDYRPAFYPAPTAANTSRRTMHSKQESTFSIASISSFGRVVNNGIADPFDYGLPSLRERPSSEDLSLCLSGSVDDTFSFIHNIPRRQRVESDASSFYFRAPLPSHNAGHRRRESGMSMVSQGPPISLYNRSFGAQRNNSHHFRSDSSSSFSSLAHNYAAFGANGGRVAWARHCKETSVDSVASDFSAMRLGRPGIGDKMFETGAPLTSILASPSGSQCSDGKRDSGLAYSEGRRDSGSSYSESKRDSGSSYSDSKRDSGSSYDSIMDADPSRPSSSLEEDSLFEKTGNRSSSASDESVFGYDKPNTTGIQRRLLGATTQYRPISVLSFESSHSPEKESDTMISMLAGGHVRRLSVSSNVNASPCVGKRKHSHLRYEMNDDFFDHAHQESPKKARIIEKPSIASTSSFKFGDERMIRATRGLFTRQSLEENCLSGDGEDMTTSFHAVPVFSKPAPTSRSRSSTCTTSSSGNDTPPLSCYDSSSQSGGSVSSIDLAHVNSILANATHPLAPGARARARNRSHGHGHRRRYSQAHLSRSSVYETIEEELSGNSAAPSPVRKNSPTIRQAVYIVEPESPEYSMWDDERDVDALRRYYTLRDEAHDTVTESKRIWMDTPFSVFALQSFNVPRHPSEMKALLEHSVQSYGPLPRDFCRRVRSRTSSRVSPYPATRVIRRPTVSPKESQSSLDGDDESQVPPVPLALRTIAYDPNVQQSPRLPPSKPWDSPDLAKDVVPCRENAFGLAPQARPRVGSGARRVALGWSKRSNGPKSSTGQKENIGTGQGGMMTPGEGLRINRPRPKGRATPASVRPARVRA